MQSVQLMFSGSPRCLAGARRNGVRGHRSLSKKIRCASSTPSDIAADVKDTVELGKSGLEVSSVGIGVWSWGDRSGYWGYGREYGKSESQQAYKALINANIDLMDTAEVYGFGKSEEFLGEFIKQTNTSPVVATKFAPQPWRLTADSVPTALKASLKRLQQDSVGLYMIHWPGFFINAFFNDAYVEGLAQCVDQGLTKAVGVSNFNKDRVRSAHKILADRGVPLATNQVQYSLLYRAPEKNGVMEACKECGVTLVAYSPMCQGLLTGKYTPDNLPTGPRGNFISADRLREIQPLLEVMKEVGEEQGGKTLAQVAINWTLCKGTVPIPGAKNPRQVEEIAGALGWRLSEDQVRALDDVSDKIPASLGAPFENW